MGTKQKTDPPRKRTELEVIRVETALSRFPVHRLAKQGMVNIELREADDGGTETLRWEVSHNSKYGQPGPLAYKLDTIVINRRIEEVSRPTPKIIRLGSLSAIARELGGSTHDTTHTIKRALYQNASAFITAKIRYRANDGTERTLEAGFTRYHVVFTGERLPDGRTADAVYIVLSEIYTQVIDSALERPLDFDYLRDLPPMSQRWYELASYQIFGAVRRGRSRARLAYSEFCTCAPQTRYADYERVKRQMHKVHAPHREAGYVAEVAFEATTDREGRPDWVMIYVPGPKAEAEHRAFTQRGGIGPIVEAPEPTGLEGDLVSRGVTRGVAAELVRDYSEGRIRGQIAAVDWLREERPAKIGDFGAYLVGAIREDYAMPPGFRAKVERAGVEQQEIEARAAKAGARDERVRIKAYWDDLSPEERRRVDAEALARADAESRAACAAETRVVMRRMLMVPIRESYLRRLLGMPPIPAVRRSTP